MLKPIDKLLSLMLLCCHEWTRSALRDVTPSVSQSVRIFTGKSLPRIRSTDKQGQPGKNRYPTYSEGVSGSIGITRFTVIRELTEYYYITYMYRRSCCQ